MIDFPLKFVDFYQRAQVSTEPLSQLFGGLFEPFDTVIHDEEMVPGELGSACFCGGSESVQIEAVIYGSIFCLKI